MHIVQLFAGVLPPAGYGGIERMVYWPAREFSRQGHTVTVIGDPRSRIAEELPDIRFVPLTDDTEDFRRLLPTDADIVHLHEAPPLDRLPDMPYVVTEHGNRSHFTGHAPNTV